MMLQFFIYLVWIIGMFCFYGFTFGYFYSMEKTKLNYWISFIFSILLCWTSFIGIGIMYLSALYLFKENYLRKFKLY